MGTGRLLIWLAVVLVTVDLVFFSGASNFLASPQSRILNQLIVLGVMIAFGVATMRGAVDLRSPLVLPGLAWIVATAVATLLSQRPANSLEGLALLLLAAPAYLVVRAVVWADWLRSRLTGLIVAATAVFVVAYLVQSYTQWLSWWSVAGLSVPPLRPGDVGLTVGTVNAVAAYLELLAPVAIWLSWTMRHSRALTGSLAVLSLAALVVTGSRGAWLGALVGSLVLAAAIWLDHGRPLPRVPTDRTGRALAGTVALVVVGCIVVLGPLLVTRLLSGDAGRIELWTAAWSMFIANPMADVGPGAFPDVRALYPISHSYLAVLTTSHNSVLQVLAESGIVGLIAAIWLVVAVAGVAVRAIRSAPTPADRILREICLASLVALAAHSTVDTQFHLPAIVLLTFHLVARLDPPRPSRPAHVPRSAVLVGAVAVAVGALVLVPIDIAMVRAERGNLALGRGDAAAALPDFEAAAALHELGPYRLGEALARARLGDPSGAAAAFARLDALQPFTFVVASRALGLTTGQEQDDLLARLAEAVPYDPTATVNAAILRYPHDRSGATRDLAAAMAGAPPLIYSARPPDLFDDATWTAAQRAAIGSVRAIDPVAAAAAATLAGHDDLADEARIAVAPDSPEAQSLDLLATSVRTGRADLDAAHALLRAAPTSASVQGTLWTLGFQAGSQELIDAVQAVAIPLFLEAPLPPVELVTDGGVDAYYSLRLPRYPMASNGRQGPDRPYPPGMITIEPVYRPR